MRPPRGQREGQHERALKVMPMPADGDAAGEISGGWVMAHIDMAGGVPTCCPADGRMAPVAVKQIVFKKPIALVISSLSTPASPG